MFSSLRVLYQPSENALFVDGKCQLQIHFCKYRIIDHLVHLTEIFRERFLSCGLIDIHKGYSCKSIRRYSCTPAAYANEQIIVNKDSLIIKDDLFCSFVSE